MTISCQEVRSFIPWWLDDEIESCQERELEMHLQACVACQAFLDQEKHIRQLVQKTGSTLTASPRLRQRVRQSLDNAVQRPAVPWLRLWPAIATAIMLLVMIWRGDIQRDPLELSEITHRQARNLPLDVVAADVTQVQSYLNERLPFAVRLPKTKGTPVHLRGGRITQLHNKETAYVRYEVPRGRMEMFVYEATPPRFRENTPHYRIGQRSVMIQRAKGYTVVRWYAAGLAYSVVTDLPEPEIVTMLRMTSY